MLRVLKQRRPLRRRFAEYITLNDDVSCLPGYFSLLAYQYFFGVQRPRHTRIGRFQEMVNMRYPNEKQHELEKLFS
ncbi:hypothetical protein HW452_16530 [Halomonas aquamarina]|uniref:Uncharacterized protein n=1 Tax=Vreelandella aquamarina TaxID=77097 RepID=A0ACC5VY94_9GAMM|nr:hypothetical protein [Halomonas aquamarina]MBZ5489127.1 hypothetical protein [Halomonas aquamarina]